MLPLRTPCNLPQDSLAQCSLSNALLEMQWGIVHEDVSVFARSLALLEHWAFCIQHETSIRSLLSSTVFAVYYFCIPKSAALPPLILHSLFPLLFAFQGPTSSYNCRQLFISPMLVHAAETLCHLWITLSIRNLLRRSAVLVYRYTVAVISANAKSHV